jgi:hypothetical protein
VNLIGWTVTAAKEKPNRSDSPLAFNDFSGPELSDVHSSAVRA